MEYTKSELMVINAARFLKDGEVVFTGVGLPNIATNLAMRTHAKGLHMIYETGVIGSRPATLPLSIGDPCIVTGSLAVRTMAETFMFYLQGGLIDVGFLGGAQIDKFGNLNTSVIGGDYFKPKVRLPGSGGACAIGIHAKRILIIMRQRKRSFVEKVDFITTAGFLGGGDEREKLGIPGGGPEVVITDLGIFKFDPITKEMYLFALHPGATVEEVKENVGWELKVAEDLTYTEPPKEEEIRIVREIDPDRVYLD